MSEIKMPGALVMRPIGELLPYARNAKQHSDEQIELIMRSMQEFGWTNPVLVADDGILAGHGRVLAGDRLRVKMVPTLDLSHLSETQRKAYVLADNQIPNFGTSWDLTMLREELGDLEADGFDLSLTGFTLDELGNIMTPDDLPPTDKDPDSLPEVPKVAHSQLGDVWILGPHRVICGDATRMDVWDDLMMGEKADLVWTDPPYNVDLGAKNADLKKAGKGNTKAGAIKNDAMDDDEFGQFMLDAHVSLFAVLKPGAAIYVAHPDREAHQFHAAFRKAGFKFSGCVIWEKNNLVLGRTDYQNMHEPIIYGWKPGAGHRWFGGRKQTTMARYGDSPAVERLEDGRYSIMLDGKRLVIAGDVTVDELEPSIIFAPKPARSDKHPSTKPVALIAKMLGNSARHNDIVVDAFGGSGSTLIAAEMMGMCARLVELDPKFVDVIAQRYYDFTGRAPVHAVTGEEFPVAVSKEKEEGNA